MSGVMLALQAMIHRPLRREIAAANSSRILFSGLRPSLCLRYSEMTVHPPSAVVWAKTALCGSEGSSSASCFCRPKQLRRFAIRDCRVWQRSARSASLAAQRSSSGCGAHREAISSHA